jgi:hypothetical protein
LKIKRILLIKNDSLKIKDKEVVKAEEEAAVINQEVVAQIEEKIEEVLIEKLLFLKSGV